jgi:hypothetical protein
MRTTWAGCLAESFGVASEIDVATENTEIQRCQCSLLNKVKVLSEGYSLACVRHRGICTGEDENKSGKR